MELVIPIVGAGWLYLISKQAPPRPTLTEAFTSTLLPSTKVDVVESKIPSSDYYTDMAGRRVAKQSFSSQNMVPFFGRQKNIGKEFKSQADATLDVLTGGGSVQFVKQAVAPLFNPNENVQYPLGSPNNNDFYQSRVNPSTVYNNVKPFQDIKVGPGLDRGYDAGGNAGFNSGMEAREKWLPPTVDELRAANKPKTEFEGRITGPPLSAIQNLGIAPATVEKHLPDRYYVNTPDRYFATPVTDTAPTYRSEQMTPEVSRVHDAYTGAAGNSGVENQTQKPLVRLDHRQQFKTPLALAPATGAVPRSNVEAERGSMAVYDNNRTSTSPEHAGNIQGLISAITAPITDLLRPSRKENTLIPKRIGNPAPPVQSLPLLPTQVALKDPTLFSPYDLGSRPHKATEGAYEKIETTVGPTLRQDYHTPYTGNAAMFPKPTSYESGYNATIESNRANEGRTAGGNSNVFLGHINQTSKPREHFASMGGGPKAMFSQPPSSQLSETRLHHQYKAPDRNHPSILDAFKENPYTHSLQSVA